MRDSVTPKLVAGFILTISCALVLTSASKDPFSVHDRAYYASERDIDFVRPGLIAEITSAAIAADGTITAHVRFTDPRGLPLDLNGITTPGAISNGNPGMIAGVFQPSIREFRAFTTRMQSSTITGNSAVQASNDSGGSWQKTADGEYNYTFKTRAPSDDDRSAVHSIGIYASRSLAEFELGTQLDDDVYYFIPATGKETANPHQEILTASCQNCHGPNMHFHGETGRTSVEMCDQCHTSQTTDPDTGNTLNLRVMAHKIHMGAQLPSVQAGKPYQIIGFGNSVNDYSTVEFPAPIEKCTVCHQQDTGAAQADAYYKYPNRAACGACHDDVDFATGKNHASLPQISDNLCNNCHIPQGEFDFDVSIMGAHVVPQESSLLTGLQWGIEGVQNGVAGGHPTVTFTVKDKNGDPLPLSALNRVFLTIAGPTTDYVKVPNGYIQEDAGKAQGSNGVYTYTFTAAIPADAHGTWAVGLEGRRVETVLMNTLLQRSIQYGATNPVMYFSVDGSTVQPRRQPTTPDNCLTCHYRLALHGENRVNNTEYCAFCHNPVGTDAARRPASANPPQTIDLKFMVHRIHGGEQLHDEFGVDYSVFGFGGTATSFAEVRYPAPLNECFKCHVNGSENPSLQALSESPVTTPRYPVDPMQPVTTACYACHANNAMLSHALANTTVLGESCQVCHGPNADFSATREHADEIMVNAGQAAH